MNRVLDSFVVMMMVLTVGYMAGNVAVMYRKLLALRGGYHWRYKRRAKS